MRHKLIEKIDKMHIVAKITRIQTEIEPRNYLVPLVSTFEYSKIWSITKGELMRAE
jgi:hypothetical protein